MGYGFTIRVVEGEWIRSIVGSQDQRTLAEVKQYNKDLGGEIHGVNDETLTEERAITEIVMGTLPAKTFDCHSDAFVYGYAYLRLCDTYSVATLSNRYWEPGRRSADFFDFINEIQDIYSQAGLSSLGIVDDLVFRGPLLSDLPAWDAWEYLPFVGYVKWAEIQQIASELKGIDINKLVEGHDTWTQGALREVYEWYKAVNCLPEAEGEGDWTLIGSFC